MEPNTGLPMAAQNPISNNSRPRRSFQKASTRYPHQSCHSREQSTSSTNPGHRFELTEAETVSKLDRLTAETC
jgi:hypothetical protein